MVAASAVRVIAEVGGPAAQLGGSRCAVFGRREEFEDREAVGSATQAAVPVALELAAQTNQNVCIKLPASAAWSFRGYRLDVVDGVAPLHHSTGHDQKGELEKP